MLDDQRMEPSCRNRKTGAECWSTCTGLSPLDIQKLYVEATKLYHSLEALGLLAAIPERSQR